MTENEWSVHVVHPYTYQFNGNTNVLGPISKNAERDLSLSTIFSGSVKAGNPIVHYWHLPYNSLAASFSIIGLSIDENFRYLFDENVINFTTNRKGLPLQNHRPAEIKRKHYSRARKMWDRGVNVVRRTPQTANALFIGGIYENCLGNFVDWYCTNARPKDQRVVMCPELSVKIDENEFVRVRNTLLSKHNIDEMTAEEAICSFTSNLTSVS